MRKQDVDKWAFGIIGIRKEVQVKNHVNRIEKNAPYKKYMGNKTIKEKREIQISKRIHNTQNRQVKKMQMAEINAKDVQHRDMRFQFSEKGFERAF